MTALRLILAASILFPSSASAAVGAVPVLKARPDSRTPDFSQAPVENDFASLVLHLGDTIMDETMPQKRVPGVDRFLAGLEDALHEGNDIPRGRIVRNASAARDSLRRAFNDLSAAGSKPHLKDISSGLAEIAEELIPLIVRAEDAVREIGAVADAARAQVGAMVLRPPASPGAKTPLYRLDAIAPLEPEIKKLMKRLRLHQKRLAVARGYVGRAKKQASEINGFAAHAGHLDEKALGHLSQRRTRGIPADYKTQMFSQKIIENANGYVVRAVESGEKIVKEMEDQLDPKFEQGLAWSLNRLLEADGRIRLAAEAARQSGKRINFNHEVRLNKYISNGWEVTQGTRRENWWIGRSNMAISEAQVDSGKIDAAHAAAARAAGMAGEAARAGTASVKRLGKSLGRFRDRPYRMPGRKLDVPPLPKVRRAKDKPKADAPSQKLKVPKTFNVSDQEITNSFDGLGGR